MEATETGALLGLGSRIETEHLKELENALAVSLRSGRNLGGKSDRPPAWHAVWRNRWERVERIMGRTGALVNDMIDGVAIGSGAPLKQAMVAWEAIQSEHDLLQETLGCIRVLAGRLNGEERRDWNRLAHALEAQLAAIHSCAQELRTKLELLEAYSEAGADAGWTGPHPESPNGGEQDGAEAELYDHEFRRAALTLGLEHHQPHGPLEFIKGLLMWVETPEERMIKNRSLTLAE